MRAVVHRQRLSEVDLDAITAELRAFLSLQACWFEPWPYDRELPVLERGRVVLPADEPGVASYSTWSSANGVALPVRSPALELGRFVLVPPTPTVGLAWDPTERACVLEFAQRWGRALASRLEFEGSLA